MKINLVRKADSDKQPPIADRPPTMPHVVGAGEMFSLDDIDPRAPAGCESEYPPENVAQQIEMLRAELLDLQALMYGASIPKTGASKVSLVIVLQGVNGAGKDSAIKLTLKGWNALWLRADAFKVPIFDERGQDFLWRSHRVVPPPGFTTALHRSYYEGVMGERGNNKIDLDEVYRRYSDIGMYERMLARNETITLKFFLNITKDEQRRRLVEREKLFSTAWKLSPEDWKEHNQWGKWQSIFSDALSFTSSDVAPWYVVPNQCKWYGCWLMMQTIADVLRPYRDIWLAILKDERQARLDAISKYRS